MTVTLSSTSLLIVPSIILFQWVHIKLFKINFLKTYYVIGTNLLLNLKKTKQELTHVSIDVCNKYLQWV